MKHRHTSSPAVDSEKTVSPPSTVTQQWDRIAAEELAGMPDEIVQTCRRYFFYGALAYLGGMNQEQKRHLDEIERLTLEVIKAFGVIQ